MATQLPIVFDQTTGSLSHLQPGDSIAGVSLAPKVVTLSFGPVARRQQVFQIADAAAVPTSVISISALPDSDEYEMDAFVVTARCTVAGMIAVYVTAIPGPVNGVRQFVYFYLQ